MAIEQKIGSTVKLVSGGPSMTIVKIGEADELGKVQCYWYDASGVLQSNWYPVATLIPAPQVGG